MIFFFFPLSFVFYNIAKAWMLPVRKRESITLVLQQKRGNKCWFLTKFTAASNILLLPINYFSLKLLLPRRSQYGSNQPEPLSIEFPGVEGQSTVKAKAKPKAKPKAKSKAKQNAKKKTTIPMHALDSPAMGTRSKKMDSASSAMSTRSKRRLSL